MIMAAVVARCGCGCPRILVTSARRPPLFVRFLSTKANIDQQKSLELENETPQRRKKRDKFTVLKALSSTVQKVPGTSSIQFLEDAYLMPRSDFTKREFIAAMESGRNAAEFIIKKYPELCKLREPVPAWPDEFAVFEEKEDEVTLNFLIKSDKVEEAVKLYELLQQKDVIISKDTVVSFLDFVGYHGVGIKNSLADTGAADDEKEKSSSSSSSDSESSSSEEEEDDEIAKNGSSKEADPSYGFKVKDLLLSEYGYATRVFESIEEKSAEVYEAYILALLKYGEFSVARRLHDEMRDKGFKGSTYLYKSFLDGIDRTKENLNSNERWSLVEEYLSKMEADSAAIPNIDIYNSMLNIASKFENDAPQKTKMVIREMLANGIEPSLGSYLYVFDGHHRNRSERLALFNDVVSRLSERKDKLQVQDIRDVEFFSSAMTMARGYGDAEAAKLLLKVAYKDGNWALLGTSTSSFLGNYLSTLARSEKDIDFVFEEFDRLVPNEFVPRDWVFSEIFKRLEQGEGPKYIFKLCSDMKIHRVRLTYSVCERIFSALSAPLPQELYKEGLDTALEIMKWMSMFDIPVSGTVLSQVARLYSLNGMLNDAWDTVALFEEKNLKPSSDMMRSILECAAEKQDQRMAMKVAKKMAGYDQKLQSSVIDGICEKLQLTDGERYQLNSLIGKN